MFGEFSRTRDQIYLPRGEASTEEILLRQRQLLTGYQYFFNFGISYSFGSIFNNIVNPRFGGGGGGLRTSEDTSRRLITKVTKLEARRLALCLRVFVTFVLSRGPFSCREL